MYQNVEMSPNQRSFWTLFELVRLKYEKIVKKTSIFYTLFLTFYKTHGDYIMLKLKLGLDHLKFKSSENGPEMMSFGQKFSFIIFFIFWSILSL